MIYLQHCAKITACNFLYRPFTPVLHEFSFIKQNNLFTYYFFHLFIYLLFTYYVQWPYENIWVHLQDVYMFPSLAFKHNHSFCSLLVHDSVSTFSASDGITCFDFILIVAFSTDVDHGCGFGCTRSFTILSGRLITRNWCWHLESFFLLWWIWDIHTLLKFSVSPDKLEFFKKSIAFRSHWLSPFYTVGKFLLKRAE